MTERTLIWSYGGGTQSIAIAVLVAQGRLPKPKHVIFADTGREASETMEYFEANVRPLFDKCGLTLEVAGHETGSIRKAFAAIKAYRVTDADMQWFGVRLGGGR